MAGVTLVDLFRLGNANNPRMDHVRPKDIDMFDVNGERWVRAGTGGISTSELAGPLRGQWWRLSAGYAYKDLLLVWNDHDTHWSWEPAMDMRLADYQVALSASHRYFVKV